MNPRRLSLVHFILSLAMLLSLLIVTFMSLAHPDFQWWTIGVALVTNLPLACLSVWLIICQAKWLEQRGVRSHWRYIVEIASIIALFLFVRLIHLSVLSGLIPFPVPLKRMLLPAILISVVLVQFTELYLYRQRVQREIDKKVTYQRMMLRRQLSPHFLFNSLNVLSALTYQDAEVANRFVKKLSRTYRYILDTQEHLTVPLSDELRFVEDYAYLQHIRFGDAVCVVMEQNPKTSSRQIIPGSIQQLVENAIKHNVATADNPLRIIIRIEDEAVVVSNHLQLRPEAARHGTGLSYLEKQFQLFGKNVIITKTESSFVVRLPFVA